MNRTEFIEMLEDNFPNIAGKSIWVWGTGHTAELYQEGLKRLDKFTVCGYCDNDRNKWGGEIFGKIVVSPDELCLKENVLVLICSAQRKVLEEVGSQLDGLKIEWHGMDELIFKLYKDECIACYDLLTDDKSKEVFSHMIDCRMKGIMPDEAYIDDDSYFILKQFRKYGKETFVDCGAYTGDTLEKYIWMTGGAFDKIVAFEPDMGNFKAMEYRVERLRKEWNLKKDSIELHCCGVGKENNVISFKSMDSMGSHIAVIGKEDSYNQVEVVSLDSMLDTYSFLKADVESMEYDVLMGARKSIIENKPRLAICIYHNAVDMFSLLLLLHEFVPEYKFAIRHHSITYDETILYAWI